MARNDAAQENSERTMHVLLADDHDLFTDMMKFFIEDIYPDASVTTVSNFADALSRIVSGESFDIVMLDLNMPGMDPTSGIARMRAAAGDTPVVIISGSTEGELVRACLRNGASGFVPKTLSSNKLLAALKLVLAGERYIPSAALETSDADSAFAPSATPPPTRAAASTNGTAGDEGNALTSREQEVLEALLKGISNKEIARDLGISQYTVKIHLQKIYRKIGAKSRADAIRKRLSMN